MNPPNSQLGAKGIKQISFAAFLCQKSASSAKYNSLNTKALTKLGYVAVVSSVTIVLDIVPKTKTARWPRLV